LTITFLKELFSWSLINSNTVKTHPRGKPTIYNTCAGLKGSTLPKKERLFQKV